MPPTPSPAELEVLDWARFDVAIHDLAGAIARDRYRPGLIVAVARGGLAVAGALGYALSVKNVVAMNVEYYTGLDERLPAPVVLSPPPDLLAFRDERVLVVDDVADTGHTLALVEAFCRARVAEVRTAVVYEKPRSVVTCDYAWARTAHWIQFPWSAAPPVVPASPGTHRVVATPTG